MTPDLLSSRVGDVEAKSAGFRKELGLVTLVLTQIMYIVGSGWVGTAAKLGPSHVIFWCLAILLFYLPQAAVVIYLNRLMPLEGGLYQWATVGLGEFWGFLTAWNLWTYAVLIMATFGVMIATNISYFVAAAWPAGAALSSIWWYTPVVSATVVVAMAVVAILGLRIGKWLQGIGGAAQILTYIGLIAVPFIALSRGRNVSYHPL